METYVLCDIDKEHQMVHMMVRWSTSLHEVIGWGSACTHGASMSLAASLTRRTLDEVRTGRGFFDGSTSSSERGGLDGTICVAWCLQMDSSGIYSVKKNNTPTSRNFRPKFKICFEQYYNPWWPTWKKDPSYISETIDVYNNDSDIIRSCFILQPYAICLLHNCNTGIPWILILTNLLIFKRQLKL